jgi:hypothetical protein
MYLFICVLKYELCDAETRQNVNRILLWSVHLEDRDRWIVFVGLLACILRFINRVSYIPWNDGVICDNLGNI